MSFSRTEVVLLPIPFTDLSGRKVRPAVVIGRRRSVGVPEAISRSVPVSEKRLVFKPGFP